MLWYISSKIIRNPSKVIEKIIINQYRSKTEKKGFNYYFFIYNDYIIFFTMNCTALLSYWKLYFAINRIVCFLLSMFCLILGSRYTKSPINSISEFVITWIKLFIKKKYFTPLVNHLINFINPDSFVSSKICRFLFCKNCSDLAIKISPKSSRNLFSSQNPRSTIKTSLDLSQFQKLEDL